MIEVIPAILPRNYEDLKNKIALVRGVVPVAQVDICDGIFVKSITWPFTAKPSAGDEFMENNLDLHFRKILNEEEGMPFWEDIDFEIHLMVSDAVENFDIYTKLGPKRIIFHLEAVGDLVSFRDFIEGIDMYVRDSIKIGVAFNPSFDIDALEPLVSLVDFVQVMGIENVGFQGEEFNDICISHIKTLKEKFPDLIISVDGGINLDSASMVISAGAERLVIGSAIFNTDDIISEIEKFKDL